MGSAVGNGELSGEVGGEASGEVRAVAAVAVVAEVATKVREKVVAKLAAGAAAEVIEQQEEEAACGPESETVGRVVGKGGAANEQRRARGSIAWAEAVDDGGDHPSVFGAPSVAVGILKGEKDLRRGVSREERQREKLAAMARGEGFRVQTIEATAACDSEKARAVVIAKRAVSERMAMARLDLETERQRSATLVARLALRRATVGAATKAKQERSAAAAAAERAKDKVWRANEAAIGAVVDKRVEVERLLALMKEEGPVQPRVEVDKVDTSRRSGARRRARAREEAGKAAAAAADDAVLEETVEVSMGGCDEAVADRVRGMQEEAASEGFGHPAGGCRLQPEAWRRRGAPPWLVKTIEDGAAARWREGEGIETVQAFEKANYVEKGSDGSKRLAADLVKQAAANVIEWHDPAVHGPDVSAFCKVRSPFNMVPKALGGWRTVHDLSVSKVNDSQVEWPFELCSVEDVFLAMYPGCRLGTRDWEQGFFHVVCEEALRHVLGFVCPETGRVGRYRCLPMGMKQSPAIFCALTTEFARMCHAELEERGVRVWRPELGIDGKGRWSVEVFAFVDDHPIVADSDAAMEAAFAVMDEVADELGVRFKKAKDVGRPSSEEGARRQLVALGAEFTASSDECTMRLPKERAQRYLDKILEVKERWGGAGEVPLKVLDGLTGRLAWASRLCRWGKAFIGDMYEGLRGHGHVPRRKRWRKTAVADTVWSVELPFWEGFLGMVIAGEWCGVRQWQLLPAKEDAIRVATHRSATDASTSWGAGGVWGLESYAFKWTEAEADWHISWLELQAILLALRKWAPDWAGETVLLESDNTAAVAYVKNGGGAMKVGRAMMREISLLCLRYNIALRSEHIPGVRNLVPDALSRGKQVESTSDYTFSLYDKYNEVPHEVDAASALDGLNRQHGCDMWFAAGKRSFLLNWREAAGKRIWCNPPYTDIILDFMLAVERAWQLDGRTTCTMVVPNWHQKRWYRRALRRGRSAWEIVDEIPAGQRLYWRGEAERLRERPDTEKNLVPGPKWSTLVLRFPRVTKPTHVSVGGPGADGGLWDGGL